MSTTQRYRLGVSFNHIPVDRNLGRTLSFNPNSDGRWDNQPDFAEPPLPLEAALPRAAE